MAESDRINLLEEFEEQEDNKFVLLSTYSFDPIFFDGYLMDKLRKNNSAKVVVLVDADTYKSRYDEFTSKTGVEYLLIPVEMKNGVFHPKVSLFFSEDGATTYVSSANLTQQGFTSNVETVTKIEHDYEGESREFFGSVLDFFEELTEHVDDNEYREIVEDRILGSRAFDLDGKGADGKYTFLTNSPSQGSILEQMLEEVDRTSFEKITLSAPFFSPNAKVLKKLSDRIDFNEVRLLLEGNNHDLGSVDEYESLCKEIGCSFEVSKIETGSGRLSHAKLLELHGEGDNYHLVGSANMTQSALLETWETGNAEASVLVETDEVVHTDVFDTEKPDELDELLSQSVTDRYETGSDGLLITSARYEDELDNLTIKTVDRDGEGVLRIKTTGSEEDIEESISLSGGEKVINVAEGKPTEVEVKYEEETDRRKVVSKDDPLPGIAGETSAQSFEKISERFFGDEETNFGRIISFYRNANRSLAKDVTNGSSSADEDEGESEEQGENGDYGGPSEDSTTDKVSGVKGVLKELSAILNEIQEEKNRKEELENISGQEEDIPEEIEVTQEEWDKLNSVLEEFVSKSQNVLEEKKKHAEDIEWGWLSLQPVYVKAFLILISEVDEIDKISNDVFEKFDEAVQENMDSLDFDVKQDQETKRRLFAYLVVYNLINRIRGREEIEPKKGSRYITKHLYGYNELLSNENIREIRGEINNFAENNFNSLGFARDDIAKTYAKLASPCVNPENFDEGIVEICEYLTDETDVGVLRIYEEFLKKQTQYDIDEELKQEVRELPEPEAEEAIDGREVILEGENRPEASKRDVEEPEVPSGESIF
jgi:HKD family nuclease